MRITCCLIWAVGIALGGCGGCQEKELASPAPVRGQLPPTAIAQRPTPLPAKPVCAVFAFAAPESGPAPLQTSLSAEGDCNEGEPVFRWDFGDGTPPASGTVVVHTYEKPGKYSARVEISSTTRPAARDSDDIEVLVGEPQ